MVYGSHARNVLDLWLAPSDKPTPLLVNIHGGGFQAGDKRKFSASLIEMMHKEGISVGSITHWTKDDPPIYLHYPGPNEPVDQKTVFGMWVHHPIFGIKLKEAMYYQGVECYLEYKGGPTVAEFESHCDFLVQKLKSQPEGRRKRRTSVGEAPAPTGEVAPKWKTIGLQQANSMGAGAAAIPKSGRFRVFVLMGQSNMTGAARAAELESPYTEKHDRIRIWANGRWEYFVPSVRFGPGVSMARQLAAFWPNDTIGIIKVASGGTGIRGFEKKWSFERANRTFDGRKGSLYKDLMNAVAEAKRVSKPEFCGFVWKQGAADGTKKDLAEAYYETFRQLVADLRTDLSTPDLPVFVLTYLTDKELLKIEQPGGKRRYIKQVLLAHNKAGRDIAGVTTVHHGRLPVGKDGVHYNAEGQIKLGKMTADAIEKFYKAKD